MFDRKYPYTTMSDYNLDWCIERIRTLSDEWKETRTEFGDLKTEWESYKNYIDNYFENLDLSEEVSNKIDQMKDDGYFSALFVELFTDDVVESAGVVASEWISENLLQETGYVIDTSLTVSNAAADAKVVGDKLNMIDANIYNIQINKTSGSYINQNTGDLVTYSGWDASDFIDVSLCENVVYYTPVSSVYNAFYDSSKTYISGFTMTAGFLRNSPRTVKVPSGAKYVRISNTTSSFSDTFIYPISSSVSNFNPS